MNPVTSDMIAVAFGNWILHGCPYCNGVDSKVPVESDDATAFYQCEACQKIYCVLSGSAGKATFSYTGSCPEITEKHPFEDYPVQKRGGESASFELFAL